MVKKQLLRLGVGSLATASYLLLGSAPAFATVHTSDIADGAVTSAKLASSAVTYSKLATQSVGSRALVDGAVTKDKIDSGAVTASKIRNEAVRTQSIMNGAVTGSKLAGDINIESAVTRDTDATGSFQNFAGDLTYEGAAGGTSYYHAGVMGNFLGDTLTNTTASLHAGVIGSNNVTTSDANPGATAGVIGEVGDLAAGADAAVMAVLGGDGGAVTPNAAYGVQYFNSTAGSHFNYGLDLFHAATTGYSNSAVEYGTADIRLSSGATISTGSAAPSGNCADGSVYLRTGTGSEDTVLYTCSPANTWNAADL